MLKIGDIVKVREDLEVGKTYGGLSFKNKMKMYIGRAVKIDKIERKEDFNLIGIENFPIWFSEEMFIPLSEVEGDEIVDYDKCKYGYELGNVKKCDVVSIAIDNNEEDVSKYIGDGNNCISKCNCAMYKEIEEANEKESNSCNKFEIITKEMSELYKIKNANYGNSFSEQFKEYGMTSVCIRLDDKLRRLKSLNNMGSNGTNDESLRDTLIDLANYSVMAIMELDNKGE